MTINRTKLIIRINKNSLKKIKESKYVLRECIPCPRNCDLKDDWIPRLVPNVPVKNMGLYQGDSKDLKVCSKTFGKDEVSERLNATEAYEFCFNLGCKSEY